MSNQAHSAYLESRILTADPLELIRLMYQAAIGEVRSARQHLANRAIRPRSQAISKACAILTELTVALDRKAAGEYAGRMADLYGYMMRKLAEANFQQRDEPMVEVLGLLSTLLEGWEGVQRLLDSKSAQPIQAGPWTAVQETAYTPQAWSF
ncbi:MAG: flagellar export chaperone FliS [Bryobacteraceae bacterium]|jgi:flagellar secretion chaperone FliS